MQVLISKSRFLSLRNTSEALNIHSKQSIRHLDDLSHVADEKAIVLSRFHNMSSGEGTERWEGEDILAKMETWEPQGGVFPIRNFHDRMDMTADVKMSIRRVFRFVDDADVCDVEVICLIEFRREVFDFPVVVAFDQSEGDSNFGEEGKESSDNFLGLAGCSMEEIAGDD